MEKEYALALKSALRNGTDEQKLVAGLVAHLKGEGRTKLLPGILSELRKLEARDAKLQSSVEVASESDADAALRSAKEAGIEAAKAVVNPSLITGWRARSGSVLVDRSGKQALVDLYQKITN